MVKKSRSKRSLRRVQASTSIAEADEPTVEPAEAADAATAPLDTYPDGSSSVPHTSAVDTVETSDEPHADIPRDLSRSGQEAADFVAHDAEVDRLQTPPPTHPTEEPPNAPTRAQPNADPANPALPPRVFQPPDQPGEGDGSSPLRPGPDGWVLTDHTLDSVRPYVIRDLAEARPTTIDVWFSTYLGMELGTFQNWSSEISKAGWFRDKEIQDALRKYCSTNVEKARYEPLVSLFNRIVTLGRGLLPLAGRSQKQYPVDDLVFVNNADRKSTRLNSSHSGESRMPSSA